MRSRKMWMTAAAAVMFAAGAAAAADAPGDVTVKLEGFSVQKGKDGKESFLPSDKMKPGDIIEYRAVYNNGGKEALKDVHAVLPVPEGMEYLPGTARPANGQASLDGRSFADIPLKRRVKRADGKTEEVLVPYAEYRALGWKFKTLAPAKPEKVQARMRITPVAQASGKAQQAAPAKKEVK